MYFISAKSWLHFTSLIQIVACGDDLNPLITWGKYKEIESDWFIMPVLILVHYVLVDGSHIAQFYINLDQEIEKYCFTI